jgi:hypothetical protein
MQDGAGVAPRPQIERGDKTRDRLTAVQVIQDKESRLSVRGVHFQNAGAAHAAAHINDCSTVKSPRNCIGRLEADGQSSRLHAVGQTTYDEKQGDSAPQACNPKMGQRGPYLSSG